jgi:hypothetical protein
VYLAADKHFVLVLLPSDLLAKVHMIDLNIMCTHYDEMEVLNSTLLRLFLLTDLGTCFYYKRL